MSRKITIERKAMWTLEILQALLRYVYIEYPFSLGETEITIISESETDRIVDIKTSISQLSLDEEIESSCAFQKQGTGSWAPIWIHLKKDQRDLRKYDVSIDDEGDPDYIFVETRDISDYEDKFPTSIAV